MELQSILTQYPKPDLLLLDKKCIVEGLSSQLELVPGKKDLFVENKPLSN